MICSRIIQFSLMPAFLMVYKIWMWPVSICLNNSLTQKRIATLFLVFSQFGWGISISVPMLCVSGCTPTLDTISPMKGMLVHLKWHLSLLGFLFCTSSLLFSVCHHGPYCLFHILQLKCHSETPKLLGNSEYFICFSLDHVISRYGAKWWSGISVSA